MVEGLFALCLSIVLFLVRCSPSFLLADRVVAALHVLWVGRMQQEPSGRQGISSIADVPELGSAIAK